MERNWQDGLLFGAEEAAHDSAAQAVHARWLYEVAAEGRAGQEDRRCRGGPSDEDGSLGQSDRRSSPAAQPGVRGLLLQLSAGHTAAEQRGEPERAASPISPWSRLTLGGSSSRRDVAIADERRCAATDRSKLSREREREVELLFGEIDPEAAGDHVVVEEGEAFVPASYGGLLCSLAGCGSPDGHGLFGTPVYERKARRLRAVLLTEPPAENPLEQVVRHSVLAEFDGGDLYPPGEFPRHWRLSDYLYGVWSASHVSNGEYERAVSQQRLLMSVYSRRHMRAILALKGLPHRLSVSQRTGADHYPPTGDSPLHIFINYVSSLWYDSYPKSPHLLSAQREAMVNRNRVFPYAFVGGSEILRVLQKLLALTSGAPSGTSAVFRKNNAGRFFLDNLFMRVGTSDSFRSGDFDDELVAAIVETVMIEKFRGSGLVPGLLGRSSASFSECRRGQRASSDELRLRFFRRPEWGGLPIELFQDHVFRCLRDSSEQGSSCPPDALFAGSTGVGSSGAGGGKMMPLIALMSVFLETVEVCRRETSGSDTITPSPSSSEVHGPEEQSSPGSSVLPRFLSFPWFARGPSTRSQSHRREPACDRSRTVRSRPVLTTQAHRQDRRPIFLRFQSEAEAAAEDFAACSLTIGEFRSEYMSRGRRGTGTVNSDRNTGTPGDNWASPVSSAHPRGEIRASPNFSTTMSRTDGPEIIPHLRETVFRRSWQCCSPGSTARNVHHDPAAPDHDASPKDFGVIAPQRALLALLRRTSREQLLGDTKGRGTKEERTWDSSSAMNVIGEAAENGLVLSVDFLTKIFFKLKASDFVNTGDEDESPRRGSAIMSRLEHFLAEAEPDISNRVFNLPPRDQHFDFLDEHSMEGGFGDARRRGRSSISVGGAAHLHQRRHRRSVRPGSRTLHEAASTLADLIGHWAALDAPRSGAGVDSGDHTMTAGGSGEDRRQELYGVQLPPSLWNAPGLLPANRPAGQLGRAVLRDTVRFCAARCNAGDGAGASGSGGGEFADSCTAMVRSVVEYAPETLLWFLPPNDGVGDAEQANENSLHAAVRTGSVSVVAAILELFREHFLGGEDGKKLTSRDVFILHKLGETSQTSFQSAGDPEVLEVESITSLSVGSLFFGLRNGAEGLTPVELAAALKYGAIERMIRSDSAEFLQRETCRI